MGTDRTAIIPTITLEGVGASVSPATAQNFTAGAVNYTVSDMISSKVYAVTLLEQGAGLKGVISGVNYDGKTIRNNNQQLLQVYDAMGRLVTSGTNDIDMRGNAKGIYMIKSASGLMKIVF
jgi:hypothetical protein